MTRLTICPRPVDALILREKLLAQCTGSAMLDYYCRIKGISIEQAEGLASDAFQSLLGAEVYFVSADIAALLGTAAPGLPDYTLRRESLPTPGGFVAFEQPVAQPSYYAGDAQPSGREGDGDLGGFAWRPQGGGIRLVFYTVFRNEVAYWLMPLAVFTWPFGAHLESMLARKYKQPGFIYDPCQSDKANAVLPERSEAKQRVFAAFLAFLEQRLVTTRPERPDRGARRRYERDHGEEAPDVRVVHLRQPSARDGDRSHDGEPHVWSCRWLVSGHWRRQWYGREKTHAPRWIAPYVKGNPSAPLKPPSRRVFAVVR